MVVLFSVECSLYVSHRVFISLISVRQPLLYTLPAIPIYTCSLFILSQLQPPLSSATVHLVPQLQPQFLLGVWVLLPQQPLFLLFGFIIEFSFIFELPNSVCIPGSKPLSILHPHLAHEKVGWNVT